MMDWPGPGVRDQVEDMDWDWDNKLPEISKRRREPVKIERAMTTSIAKYRKSITKKKQPQE